MCYLHEFRYGEHQFPRMASPAVMGETGARFPSHSRMSDVGIQYTHFSTQQAVKAVEQRLGTKTPMVPLWWD